MNWNQKKQNIKWESTTHSGEIRRVSFGGLGDFGWATHGVRKTDGAKTDIVQRKSLSELRKFLRDVLPGYGETVTEDLRSDSSAEREQIAAMISAGELPPGLRGRASQLGLWPPKPEIAGQEAVVDFVPEDSLAVFEAWINRDPQREFFSVLAPDRRALNFENLNKWIASHREALPLSTKILDRAWNTLELMNCVQREPVVHRRSGARAQTYVASNDPTLKSGTFTDTEVVTARKKLIATLGLSSASTVTLDQATKIIGEEMAEELARRGGR